MKIFSLILFGSLIFISTMAFGIDIDGDLSDWGVTPVNQWWIPYTNSTNTGALGVPLVGISNGISYWIEDVVGDSGKVEPGYGGQVFDIEALYAKLEGGILYFAASVGEFAPGGVWSGNEYYFMGDIGLNFGGSYNYGVTTTDHDGYGNGTLYSGVVWTNPLSYPTSGPLRINTGTYIQPIDFIYTNNFYNNHWTIEAAIPLNSIENQIPDSFHLTQSCGNDVGNVTGPHAPEPATMFLLGTGLIGLAGVIRRRSKK